MAEFKKLKLYFDKELALLLARKIKPHFSQFKYRLFVKHVEQNIDEHELKKRVEVIADGLHDFLPADYSEALNILTKILGPENSKETGMFTEGYWLMPIAFFVEKYGLNYYEESILFIKEVTKRNTGEYAIRPFLLAYPEKTLAVALTWSQDSNRHVRRLASEGLRPRLPWAKKIDIFSDDPSAVFEVLDSLKSDPSAYVRKSVANNVADFLKENYDYTITILDKWHVNASPETRWVIKHALRNELKKNNPVAIALVH
ncbi:MAG: 3-methyladenine DNA glycosylase AlkC [Parasphingorhabdus sp.]|jgi:3-methyladenine DNA glycosylase AlkC